MCSMFVFLQYFMQFWFATTQGLLSKMLKFNPLNTNKLTLNESVPVFKKPPYSQLPWYHTNGKLKM